MSNPTELPVLRPAKTVQVFKTTCPKCHKFIDFSLSTDDESYKREAEHYEKKCILLEKEIKCINAKMMELDLSGQAKGKVMKKGQKVKFFIHDSLVKDTIVATGTIIGRYFRSLWSIKPDPHKRLSGGTMLISESNILT